MSIIYDALQKTQKAREGESGKSQDQALRKPTIDSPAKKTSEGKRFYIPSISLPRIRIPSINWQGFLNTEYVKPAIIAGVSIAMLAVVFVISRTSADELPSVTLAEMHADVPAKAMVEIKSLWQALVAAMPKHRTIIEVQFKKNHVLNGVFISNSEKIAMINNKIFHRGDEVDGMIISEIDYEGVQLKHDDQMIFLRANL